MGRHFVTREMWISYLLVKSMKYVAVSTKTTFGRLSTRILLTKGGNNSAAMTNLLTSLVSPSLKVNVMKRTSIPLVSSVMRPVVVFAVQKSL